MSIMIKKPLWYFIFLIGAFWYNSFSLVTVAMAGSETADSPGQPVPLQGNTHIQSPGSPHPPYNSDPPTSGPHVPFIVRWGVHKVPITREIQVHNLEDGGVIIQYNCSPPHPSLSPKGGEDKEGACGELVSMLEAIAQQYQKKAEIERSKTDSKHPSRYDHLILAPYPGMDARIALTAWGRIDKFNEFDEARITKFIEAYIGIDHHPEKEE